MRFTLPLRGAGGEPVDLRRTLGSHGLVRLAPNRLAEDDSALLLPVRLAAGPAALALGAAGAGRVAIEVRGAAAGPSVRTEASRIVRHVLALEADYADFYRRAAADPDLAWVTRGAGRFARSPTVFEDVVKTICTTNCAWSATVRMTDALVRDLGEPIPGLDARCFPTPAAMAAAPLTWYRDVARAGYRGGYLRAVAAAVAAGELDLEAMASASEEELPDEELERRLRTMPGVGPYAAAHIMMLVGRFSRPVFDSWTRPAYARLSGRRPRSDRGIARRFARYGRYAGLAFWCYVTSDWHADQAAPSAARTTGSASSASA